MDAHVYAYLSNIASDMLRIVRFVDGRAEQRETLRLAAQQFPAHHRRFILSRAWSYLGYGGGF